MILEGCCIPDAMIRMFVSVSFQCQQSIKYGIVHDGRPQSPNFQRHVLSLALICSELIGSFIPSCLPSLCHVGTMYKYHLQSMPGTCGHPSSVYWETISKGIGKERKRWNRKERNLFVNLLLIWECNNEDAMLIKFTPHLNRSQWGLGVNVSPCNAKPWRKMDTCHITLNSVRPSGKISDFNNKVVMKLVDLLGDWARSIRTK
jgi:hypothetical protein